MNQMFTNAFDYFESYQDEIASALKGIRQEPYSTAYETIKQVGTIGASIFVCGNGGSASIAEHFSCDHS